MGFLTIKSKHLNRYTFSFPNYVIKKLYADYFFNSILEQTQLPIDNRPVNEAIINIADTGNHTVRRSGTTTAPSILTQPANATAGIGQDATFRVTEGSAAFHAMMPPDM